MKRVCKKMVNYSLVKQDKKAIEKILAQRSHLRFMQYCWQDKSEDFKIGIHTRELCRQIDIAFEDFKKGKSTFLVVKMPFRHGKSQILSRFLPSHFLGEFPDKEVMLVTYASSLTEKFSRYARNLLSTKQYKELYPNIELSSQNRGVQSWGIEGHLGQVTASGLTSGLTGNGYHLGLLDDYCASRKDAESDVIRASSWESFKDDFLTRRAPVSITIVLATPWHVDDIIGRIEKKIDKQSPEYDPAFPPFKILSFPATNGSVIVGVKNKNKYGDLKYHEEEINYDYLFPERFEAEWYTQQFASLGEYSASALLQCSPQRRSGNLLKMSGVKVHNNIADFPNIKYYRVWDLAHSEKQRMKDDPDWTSGTLLGFRYVNNVLELWIKNVVRIRAKAPERDNLIRAVAEKDGPSVVIGVESSLDSKDAVSIMAAILKGKRVVKEIKTKGDKVARMSYLEPVFDAGNVHILSDTWNFDWEKELKEFPSGAHDDQVDNLSAGFVLFDNNKHKEIGHIQLSGV